MSAITITRTGTTPTFAFAGGAGNFTIFGSDLKDGQAVLQFSLDPSMEFQAVDAKTSLTGDSTANFELPACDMRVNVIISNDTPSGSGQVNVI